MKNKFKSLVICIVLTVIYFEFGYSQTKKQILPYLNKHKIDLTISQPNYSGVFDDLFYKNDVFLVGERHGIAYTYDAVWSVFKHLKDSLNIKYFLLEAPFYWEINLNKYLETGNETLLKQTFFQAKGTFYANQNFYVFFKKVYQLNASLSPENKIHFLCIDVENQYKYSHAMLLSIFENHVKAKKDTCQFIQYFFKNDPEKTNEYNLTYQKYQEKWDENKTVLIKEFGASFNDINYLIKNINNKFLANADKKDLLRDSIMFENFKYKTQSINIKKDKIFGFFGIDHCYMDSAKNAKYFAAYLVKNQTKITSLIMRYSNSQTLIPSHYLPKLIRFFYSEKPYFTTKMRSNDNIFEYQRYIGILKEASLSPITLFNLNAVNSPFQNNHLYVSDLKSNKPTTNYFQYLFLIKDSPAAKPYLDF